MMGKWELRAYIYFLVAAHMEEVPLLAYTLSALSIAALVISFIEREP
jgi:hypothetical protein